MNEIIISLGELIRTVSRINNTNKGLLINADIERLDRAKKILSKYSDKESPKIVKSDAKQWKWTKYFNPAPN